MPTLKASDTQEDARVQWTEAGLSATRGFLVTGLTGDAAKRGIDALNVSGIPKYGDLYPGTAKCAAVDISAAPSKTSVGNFKVLVQYKDVTAKGGKPDDKAKATIRVIARTIEVETEKDVEGEPLKVEYIQKNEQMLDGSLQTIQTIRTYTGRARFHLPVIGFRFERKEGQAPTAKASAYLGRVNKGLFLGYPSRMLLVTELSGVSHDGGETYQVAYEIMVGAKSTGWDSQQRYIDELTGKVPDDVSDGNGLGSFQIYEEVDFGGMNLL